MKVVTDVRTTQRTCKRASGRTRGVRVDGRVHTSGRTCEHTYVRWHVHSSRARARTKIRSSRVGLISVRLGFPYIFSIGKIQTYRNKADSSRPYFRTCERTWRVNVSTHVRTLTRPSTRTHSSVHSYATRPSTRTLTRTLGRTHVRHHVHLHSSPDVRSPRSLPFTRL